MAPGTWRKPFIDQSGQPLSVSVCVCAQRQRRPVLEKKNIARESRHTSFFKTGWECLFELTAGVRYCAPVRSVPYSFVPPAPSFVPPAPRNRPQDKFAATGPRRDVDFWNIFFTAGSRNFCKRFQKEKEDPNLSTMVSCWGPMEMCKPSDPRRRRLAGQPNAIKRHLIILPTFVDVPEIKLIRTDTTLDLSQKAEKVCLF